MNIYKHNYVNKRTIWFHMKMAEKHADFWFDLNGNKGKPQRIFNSRHKGRQRQRGKKIIIDKFHQMLNLWL